MPCPGLCVWYTRSLAGVLYAASVESGAASPNDVGFVLAFLMCAVWSKQFPKTKYFKGDFHFK